MEIKAVQKYVRNTPRKLRLVAAMVKTMKPSKAVEVLPMSNLRAAKPLAKAIRAAIANAKEQGISESDLSFKEIQIGEGPILKRGQAASRGSWHPIKKTMSHIRIVLQTTKNSKSKTQNAKKTKKK